MASTGIDALDQLLEDIAIYIGGLFDKIGNAIRDAFLKVVEFLRDVIGSIVNSLKAVVQSLADIIGNIFGKIKEFISIAVESIIKFIDEMLAGILDKITSFIDAAVDFVTGLYDRAITFIKDVFQKAIDVISSFYDKAVEFILEIVNDVKSLFIEIFDFVIDNIKSLADKVKLFIGDLFDAVKGGILEIVKEANAVVDAIKEAVKTFVTEVVDAVGGSLKDLLETISNLPDEITALAEKIFSSGEKNIAEPLIALPAGLGAYFFGLFNERALKDTEKLEINTVNMLIGDIKQGGSVETMRNIVRNIMPESPVFRALIVALLSPLILLQTMSGVAAVNAEIIKQEYSLENPHRLLEPPDVARAWFFGEISDERAINTFRRHGYTESDSELLLKIAQTIPPEGELISWFLRGIISEKEITEALLAKGWNIQNINSLLEAAFFIPPVQDLITMAVREVFTPEVAQRFGQFEDFPEAFEEFAAKQGISKEWAERYWAAHWALPSPQMGFEMLHRGVIEQADLELLLKSADVMPFWRDKIIAISYSPLTRVDIRRMHDLGVLNREQVHKAYKDIGYNDENAELLTRFTEKLNAPKVADDPNDLTQLTRSNIIKFYKDGVFTRENAAKLLLDIGLSESAVEVYLIAADIEIDIEARKAESDLIIEQAASGLITFIEAQNALDSLGLESKERTKVLARLLKEQSKHNKLPSKGDLDKMLAKNIITADTYVDTMLKLGFSQVWIERYLKML